mgnify:CR=1 FL=1
MGLDKVLAISGKPGLYELTAQTRGGFVAKSMLDGKKIAVNMCHNVSVLSERPITSTADLQTPGAANFSFRYTCAEGMYKKYTT